MALPNQCQLVIYQLGLVTGGLMLVGKHDYTIELLESHKLSMKANVRFVGSTAMFRVSINTLVVK